MIKTRPECGLTFTNCKTTDEFADKIDKRIEEQYKYVEIHWLDACICPYHESFTSNSIKKLQPKPVRTCGFLLDEDKDRIVTTMSLSLNAEGDLAFRDHHIIPRGMIQKIIHLKPIQKKTKKKKKKLTKKKKSKGRKKK